MGYYFHDLDGGDVPELIIGWARGCEESTIVDLYTCKDGTLYHLLSTGERWDYTLNKDNSIAVEPYGGSCQCRRLLRLSKGAKEMTTLEALAHYKEKESHTYYDPNGDEGSEPSKEVSNEEHPPQFVCGGCSFHLFLILSFKGDVQNDPASESACRPASKCHPPPCGRARGRVRCG